jgi:acyl phosphate:glycerol-3-phosphate acyltransferase
MMVIFIKTLCLPLFAFALGSIPWGVIFARLFVSVDIRNHGSHNIGATNVRRVAGPLAAGLTLAGDISKGALPVMFASSLFSAETPWSQFYSCMVASCAFSGHLYPLFLRFRSGGKGVATAVGCCMVLSPMACLVAILVFILVVCCFSRVSAGSLAGAAVMPFAIGILDGSWIVVAWALLTAVFIFYRHGQNILRLARGTEPSVFS